MSLETLVLRPHCVPQEHRERCTRYSTETKLHLEPDDLGTVPSNLRHNLYICHSRERRSGNDMKIALFDRAGRFQQGRLHNFE